MEPNIDVLSWCSRVKEDYPSMLNAGCTGNLQQHRRKTGVITITKCIHWIIAIFNKSTFIHTTFLFI